MSALYKALVFEQLQCLSDGDAREPELLTQVPFRWQLLARLQPSGLYHLTQLARNLTVMCVRRFRHDSFSQSTANKSINFVAATYQALVETTGLDSPCGGKSWVKGFEDESYKEFHVALLQDILLRAGSANRTFQIYNHSHPTGIPQKPRKLGRF
jgi:hypothetical protein